MINLNYAKQALVTLQLPNISVCILLATQKFPESSTSIYTQVYKTIQSRMVLYGKHLPDWSYYGVPVTILSTFKTPKWVREQTGIDIALQEEKAE